jgi:hypothetical protein
MGRGMSRWLVFVAMVLVCVFSWLNLAASISLADFPVQPGEIQEHNKIMTNSWGIATLLSFLAAVVILFLNIRWHRKQLRLPVRGS